MFRSCLSLSILLLATYIQAAEPMHQQIDRLILEKNNEKAVSPMTTDAAFLRRITLDLLGRIPTASEVRAFLNDKAKDKRQRIIDKLLADKEYPQHLANRFHLMLMERLGEHEAWMKFLQESIAKNKPWDQMVKEMLGSLESGATFFLSKRLENYGQNPVDYPGLTRDIGRLFLGKDLQCAQCHDHLFVEEYKQRDFQGLFAFIQNVSLKRGAKLPGVVEKPTMKKVDFTSVFEGKPKETGPRLPGLIEIAIPKFKKGEEYLVKPDRKKRTAGVPRFSTLKVLSEQLPTKDNLAFSKNIVNRLWFLFIGRGLVHPLDLHHAENPPSHPKVLDLLAKEFIAHKFDIRWLIRELVLSETYQRSSELPEGVEKFEPTTFLTAHEKRLSAEQLLRSVVQATGNPTSMEAKLKSSFVKAYANPAREPEIDFTPSLRSTLFLLNDSVILDLLKPSKKNLVAQLLKLKKDKLADEMYLSVLSRLPTAEERKELEAFLQKWAKKRELAMRHYVWALLASTEFAVNH